MRRSPILSCFALLLGCSDSHSPAAVDAGSRDVSTLDVPDSGITGTDAPTPPRDGTADAGASCGTAFGTRCNLITGAGCASGEACYLLAGVAGMTPLCRAAGRAGWDEACMASTDCAEGFLCVDPGRCAKLCCAEADTSCSDEAHGGRPGARCSTELNGGHGLRLCVADSGCDPFATASNRCPADSPRCNPQGDSSTCATYDPMCARPGGDGAPCCSGGCCLPGYLCVGSAGTMCDMAHPGNACRRTCNLRLPTPDSQCPTGQHCSGFNPASGLPSYFGACGPAM